MQPLGYSTHLRFPKDPTSSGSSSNYSSVIETLKQRVREEREELVLEVLVYASHSHTHTHIHTDTHSSSIPSLSIPSLLDSFDATADRLVGKGVVPIWVMVEDGCNIIRLVSSIYSIYLSN